MPDRKKIACRVSNEVLDAFNDLIERRNLSHQQGALAAIKQFIASSGIAIAEPPAKKDDVTPSERVWIEKLLALLRSDQAALKETVQAGLEAHARAVRASRKRAGA